MAGSFADWGDFIQLKRATVNGFSYQQVTFVGVPPGSPDTPSIDHPDVRERVERTFAVHHNKLWRVKTRQWFEEVKPKSLETNLSLASVDVEGLDYEVLIRHIETCRDNVISMFLSHMNFNGTGILPAGLLIDLVSNTTDLSAEEALSLLDGASPISSGRSPEVQALALAINADIAASTVIASDTDAAEIIDQLRAMSGEVGVAMNRYLLIDGHRIATGFDVTSKMMLDLPDVMLGVIKNAVESDESDQSLEADILARFVRTKVPSDKQNEFDELLSDARDGTPIKDERGLYQDAWALGILRKALLEAGERLLTQGRVHSVEHFMEAGWAEMQAIWLGDDIPTADELETRRTNRMSLTWRDAPSILGPPPTPPAPIDGLPKEVLKWNAAAQAYSRVRRGTPPGDDAPDLVGLTANKGIYEGIARVAMGDYDFRNIDTGDVLVTSSQSEGFNAIARRVGAIVTDTGGPLAHLSIIARELGIPCIAGCKNATALIPDGARIRVDADSGTVVLLD
ncbi:MAG: hypothetical protein HOL45_11620 [Chloroflexi bacterium]|nr:hypothetical protein [Chloroflexota bacterium]